jgi:hypothetical protein
MQNQPTPTSTPASDSRTSDVVQPVDFYRSDLWLRLFKNKLRAGTALAVAVYFPVALAFTYFERSSWVPNLHPDTSPLDAIFLLLYVVAWTVNYWIYWALPDLSALLFNSLTRNEVIETAERARYTAFVQRVGAWASIMIWPVLIVAACLVIMFVTLPAKSVHWQSPPQIVGDVFTTILGLLPLYFLFFVLVRLLVVVIGLQKLFDQKRSDRYTIHIWPLHPDGSGGLGEVGTVLWVGMVALVWYTVGVAILIPQILRTPSFAVVTVLLYAVALATIVLGGLRIPHDAMVQARDRQLEPISAAFERGVADTATTLVANSSDIEEGTHRLSALADRYAQLQKAYPAWPMPAIWTRQFLGQVTVVVVIPIALVILAAILKQ